MSLADQIRGPTESDCYLSAKADRAFEAAGKS